MERGGKGWRGQRDGTGRRETRWGGEGRDHMERDGIAERHGEGRDGVERDWTGQDGEGLDGMERVGMWWRGT